MTVRSLPLPTVFAAFALAACGGSSDETTTVATPPPPTPPPPTQTTPPPPPPPAAQPTRIALVVRDGKVVGGLKTATVEKGDKVVLVITSDVADEVHLHGYDKSVDVTAGRPVRLAFVASIPGRFEVELEDRGLQIADLEVRP